MAYRLTYTIDRLRVLFSDLVCLVWTHVDRICPASGVVWFNLGRFGLFWAGQPRAFVISVAFEDAEQVCCIFFSFLLLFERNIWGSSAWRSLR